MLIAIETDEHKARLKECNGQPNADAINISLLTKCLPLLSPVVNSDREDRNQSWFFIAFR